MRLHHLSVLTIIGRMYLVMAIVLIAGFTQLWFLSVLAFPVFISVMGGIHLHKRPDYMKQTDRMQTQHAIHARHH